MLTEKDLQLKIARGQYRGIFDTNHTPFSEYAKEWLERKKMNVSQSTWQSQIRRKRRSRSPRGPTNIRKVRWSRKLGTNWAQSWILRKKRGYGFP